MLRGESYYLERGIPSAALIQGLLCYVKGD